MDPFSIAIGTATVIDLSVKVIKELYRLKEAVAGAKDDLDFLLQQLIAIKAASESIETLYHSENSISSDYKQSKASEKEKLWHNVNKTLNNCGKRICELEDRLSHVTGSKDSDELFGSDVRRYTKPLDSVKLQVRKFSAKSSFDRIENELKDSKDSLSLFLQVIGLINQKESSTSNEQLTESIERLRIDVAELGSPPQYTNDVQAPLKSAKTLLSSFLQNKYYFPPHGVSSLFTGRESELSRLESIFFGEATEKRKVQKRFVIYGVEGSGKTEFCSKFADNIRNRFHAIFTVDASSEERADTSFSQIAKKGGGEPHKYAGINWLSNLEEPWLLIIDNADDPTLDPETLFPESERGHILITTRNPAHKVYGTVDSGSFHFAGLEPDAACTLLLRATGDSQIYDTQKKSSVITIADILGYLPLALIHAGKCIRSHRCSLQDFIPYFSRTRQRVLSSRKTSANVEKAKTKASHYDIDIFATYELLYKDLVETNTSESANAIELLHMFAYFHRENIREEILLKAARNPLLEKRARESKSQHIENNFDRVTISRMFKDIYVYLFKMTRGPSVVPHILRDIDNLEDIHEDQIRAALSELSARSLIIEDSKDRSYYIHPLVHIWIRERPEMRTSEQAIWCQAAATTLARAINLPLDGIGDTEEDAEFRRSLLNHVRHVQKCQKEIQRQMARNSQKSKFRFCHATGERLDDRQAGQIARFSIVYTESGFMKDAEHLQNKAKKYFCNLLGVDHPVSCLLQIALSRTYWILGRPKEAAYLQEAVLDVYYKSKGAESHEALRVMDMLGCSYSQQARFTDALNYHKLAHEGMRRILGDDCAETMKAKMNVGMAHSTFFRYDLARTMLKEASTDLSKKLGSDHPDSLVAQENLAVIYLKIDDGFVEQAHKIMQDVLTKRKLKLGREHPYTLLAMCNLARIKANLGECKEAENIMREGLAIAERNLGSLHIGTLFGRSHLGEMLRLEERFEEAENVLKDTIEKYTQMAAARNEEHSDRLIAMQSLIKCYRQQHKNKEAISLLQKAMDSLVVIGGLNHPFKLRLEEQLKELGVLKT